MAIGTALGFVGSVGARYFVSQAYHIPRHQAIIYNTIDMSVCACVYGLLRKINQNNSTTHELAVGILLVSRVAGWLSGVLVIDHCGQRDLPIMVLLNVASLGLCWFMRFLSDDRASPPTTPQESGPSAPPLEPHWKIVYF